MNPPSSGGPAAYSDAVNSLKTSLSFLENSVATLGDAVQDYPRLSSVLKNVRHYELIPQPTLSAAESSLRDEIGPSISLLLQKVETEVERLERKVDILKARDELNSGRIGTSTTSTTNHHCSRAGGRGTGGSGGGSSGSGRGGGNGGMGSKGGKLLSAEAQLKARAVQQRKAQLQYGVERLELEVQQKERERRRRTLAA